MYTRRIREFNLRIKIDKSIVNCLPIMVVNSEYNIYPDRMRVHFNLYVCPNLNTKYK